ncbi:MAG TPA: CDP-alcohol phosphatidyltransferase family protein [Candidatus Thermoplasmatota archaeon]|nr:CDP-alcohol phosphatidyltransferase family protein [Candidatus Thermoplasmatota archaeon]
MTPPEAAQAPTVNPANPAANLLKGRLQGGLWNHYFFSNLSTRLAIPWTRLFLALGLTPKAVSLLSFTLAAIGGLLVAFSPGPAWMAGFGGALFIVSLLWDHSDGQVARATKTGSLQGGLLDTILDRWIELLWVGGLCVGILAGGHDRVLVGAPAWAYVLIAAWAVHAQLYVRWSNLQLDLYLLQKELKAAPRDATGQRIIVEAPPYEKKPDLSHTWLPFAFNRDTTFWLLLAITLTPWWDVGLLAFALLHTGLGLRQNGKTFRELRKDQVKWVSRVVDPDYHK